MATPRAQNQPAEPPEVVVADEPVEISLTVADFCRDASHAVPLSGLLADKPELLEAELTADEWDAHLSEYLKSERP